MSRRNLQIIVVIIALIAVVSIGVFLYITRDVAAPSVAVQDTTEQLTVSSDASTTERLFRIEQQTSQVEYNIYELLNGQDKTVVGTTGEVAGDILINLNDLAQSQIGEININARTFATDNRLRDNSVARMILQSENPAYEFITFKPTSIDGLSGTASVGDTLEFTVTGDLTIAGITQSTTFNVTATLTADDQITGTAETVVQRAAFNLTIPRVPSVANVGEDVTLKLRFVANAVTA